MGCPFVGWNLVFVNPDWFNTSVSYQFVNDDRSDRFLRSTNVDDRTENVQWQSFALSSFTGQSMWNLSSTILRTHSLPHSDPDSISTDLSNAEESRCHRDVLENMLDLLDVSVAWFSCLRSFHLDVSATDPSIHGDVTHRWLHLSTEIDDRHEELSRQVLHERTCSSSRRERSHFGIREVSRRAQADRRKQQSIVGQSHSLRFTADQTTHFTWKEWEELLQPYSRSEQSLQVIVDVVSMPIAGLHFGHSQSERTARKTADRHTNILVNGSDRFEHRLFERFSHHLSLRLLSTYDYDLW